MKRLLLVFLVLLAPALGYSQAPETTSSGLSLQLSPGILLPLGQSDDYFRPGGSLSVSAEYRLPRLPSLLVLGGAGYEFAALEGFSQSISPSRRAFRAGHSWAF